MELVAVTPADAVIQAARMIRDKGEKVAPRGMETRELRHVQIVVMKPSAIPFDIPGRGIKPFIAAAEALQLIGQISVPELMIAGASQFGRYTDGGIFHGAYGVRVHGRIKPVIDKLCEDPWSRQAVLSIYDSRQDLGASVRDVPCTISLQFIGRDDRLDMRTSMRSNDVWLGLPYDLHQFIALQAAIAKDLNIEVGTYVHSVGSLHAYEHDLEKIDGLGDPDLDAETSEIWSGKFIDDIAMDCRRILLGLGGPSDPTPWEQFCMDAVAKARTA